MAYYAAVISLKGTLKRLLNSSPIFVILREREVIKFTYKKVCSLQRVLDELGRGRNNIRSKRVESLHEQIGDAAHKLQIALDSHVSDRLFSQPERPEDVDSNSFEFVLDIPEELQQEINNFACTVEKIEGDCRELSKYSLPKEGEGGGGEEDNDDTDSSSMGLVGTETKMVGLSDQFSHVKEDLPKHYGNSPCTYSICGMAGIGKTTMAKKIYHDPEFCFIRRLWVSIGQNYQFRNVMLRLLAQLRYNLDNIRTDSNEKLGQYLYTGLRSTRCLIVLDDVWDEKVLRDLIPYLPPVSIGSTQILVTTRLERVAQYSELRRRQTLRFLNEEESWCLLREKVFGERPCPYQLEKVGQKIANNCDGLPLLIVTVGDLLSKADKTLEYWTKIAEGEDKSIFIEANDKISNILLRSYKFLPQDLKACFLYMGVFPSRCEIPTSKLYDLWTAEDIPFRRGTLDSLDYLVSDNLVLKRHDAAIGGIKTCSLHSSFWHACVKQSWKEKFLHVVSSFADISKEGVKSRRRLCTYNNVLFGIKEVYNSMESISSACSLICSGPNHQYPVPICFGLRLLKVLDVLSIRFYKFPIEVLNLIHLRYLALTYDGKIPPSISKLWNLEYLIVRRYLSIKFLGDWSYLPMEIWNLKKLRHLQVIGSYLAYLCDAVLPELKKLSSISAHNCTKEIFVRIPNLEKLGIQIELTPNSNDTDLLSCFAHLPYIRGLRSLKCIIVNPNLTRPQLAFFTSLPYGLTKLSLSGLGYPWNNMRRVIGKLGGLRVLKLQSYAFQGPNWEVHEDEFLSLRYLLLEDLDLVHMTVHHIRSFCKLEELIIKHCYKFETTPLALKSHLKIEVVDSPLIAKYMQKGRKAILRRIPGISGGISGVRIHSSWDGEERKA